MAQFSVTGIRLSTFLAHIDVGPYYLSMAKLLVFLGNPGIQYRQTRHNTGWMVCDRLISALGLDFGQKLGEEDNITEDRPFLQQRHYAQIGTRYTKPSILAEPLRWGSGFHRIKGHNFHIVKDLYLLHFGYFDMKRLEDRFNDKDRLAQGWGKHMKKRSRTIRLATKLKARNFERWTKFARICQTLVRPPYALNKPAMFGLKIIVRIPDRFKDIV